MSIGTHIFPCQLSPNLAEVLNRESGRICTAVMVEHWRIYRKKGVWLSHSGALKLRDRYDAASAPLLHAHSVDAAQDGFYKACATAKAARQVGVTTRYPFKRKRFAPPSGRTPESGAVDSSPTSIDGLFSTYPRHNSRIILAGRVIY